MKQRILKAMINLIKIIREEGEEGVICDLCKSLGIEGRCIPKESIPAEFDECKCMLAGFGIDQIIKELESKGLLADLGEEEEEHICEFCGQPAKVICHEQNRYGDDPVYMCRECFGGCTECMGECLFEITVIPRKVVPETHTMLFKAEVREDE